MSLADKEHKLTKRIVELEKAHAEIIRRYTKVMQPPPRGTFQSPRGQIGLTFAREAWFGAASISRRVLGVTVKPPPRDPKRG